jgi:hypothetical protein
MKLQKAERHQVKLRLGLSGASGFGKTYSALLLAYGMTEDWSKIAVIDTENNSASLYSDLGNFNVLSISEPYSPERYIEAIETCENAENIEVIIIDSITMEWNGSGGCLDIHSKLGGRFIDWSIVTPRHQAFIDAILKSTCPIITTVRKKIDYSMDRDSSGKTKVIIHGLKDVTKEGFSYELTVNFELINDKHLVSASKDRTGLFMDKPEFIINSSTGKRLKQWCNASKSLKEIKEEISNCTSESELVDVYHKYGNYRKELIKILAEKKSEINGVEQNVVNQEEVIKP